MATVILHLKFQFALVVVTASDHPHWTFRCAVTDLSHFAGTMAFSGRCSFLGTQLTVAPSALAPRRAASVMPIEAAYKNKLKKYGPGKHWEHYELSKNGKAIRIKMHVKKGDTVVVRTASTLQA